MSERVSINHDIDKKTGLAFIECQVDDNLTVRVNANFMMEIFDADDADGSGWTEIPVDRFRKSFEALMKEFDERYGGRP